jgi:hypothetical protein
VSQLRNQHTGGVLDLPYGRRAKPTWPDDSAGEFVG